MSSSDGGGLLSRFIGVSGLSQWDTLPQIERFNIFGIFQAILVASVVTVFASVSSFVTAVAEGVATILTQLRGTAVGVINTIYGGEPIDTIFAGAAEQSGQFGVGSIIAGLAVLLVTSYIFATGVRALVE